MNTLYLGDNLPILQSIESESVDLIYIDPPFNSNRNYSGMIKTKKENTPYSPLEEYSQSGGGVSQQLTNTKTPRQTSFATPHEGNLVQSTSNSLILAQFEDTWRGGMKTYKLHRILKPTGSFYLHCDPTAQAYLQVEILDKIFGIN